MSTAPEGEVVIRTEGDIVASRRTARDVALSLGFRVTEATFIATAVSELARNAYKYGGGGIMRWRELHQDGRSGLELRFIDQGPGIADVRLALQEGYSTGGGLGLGLPAVKRLADELEIKSAVGQGTQVTMRKWRPD